MLSTQVSLSLKPLQYIILLTSPVIPIEWGVLVNTSHSIVSKLDRSGQRHKPFDLQTNLTAICRNDVSCYDW